MKIVRGSQREREKLRWNFALESCSLAPSTGEFLLCMPKTLPSLHPVFLFSQRCAETISLLAKTLRGDRLQETELAKRLLGILARLSRRRPAQEAVAASCFAGWAAEVLKNALVAGEAVRQRRSVGSMVWVRQRHLRLVSCTAAGVGSRADSSRWSYRNLSRSLTGADTQLYNTGSHLRPPTQN